MDEATLRRAIAFRAFVLGAAFLENQDEINLRVASPTFRAVYKGYLNDQIRLLRQRAANGCVHSRALLARYLNR